MGLDTAGRLLPWVCDVSAHISSCIAPPSVYSDLYTNEPRKHPLVASLLVPLGGFVGCYSLAFGAPTNCGSQRVHSTLDTWCLAGWEVEPRAVAGRQGPPCLFCDERKPPNVHQVNAAIRCWLHLWTLRSLFNAFEVLLARVVLSLRI